MKNLQEEISLQSQFHRGRPVHDPSLFVGRSKEAAEAILLLQQGQSVSIIGPRRIGKTSFLLHIWRKLKQKTPGQKDSPNLCPVYVDCASLGQVSAGEFYCRLAKTLDVQTRTQGIAFAAPVIKDATHITFRQFEQVARAAREAELQVIFLLDEFECLSENPALDVDVFSSLRALAMEQSLTYATASTRPLLELNYSQVSVLSSPFFNFFAPLSLGLLNPEEARLLLETLSTRSGIPFEAALIDRLCVLAGSHPLLLQIAGHHAFECLRRTGQYADAVVREAFLDEARPHLEYFWKHLDEEDRRLLALLPIAARGDRQGVRRLEKACLILRVAHAGKPDEWRPFCEVFGAFVARQPARGLRPAPPIMLDEEQHLVLLQGVSLILTLTEFSLLACLVEAPGQIVPRSRLEACLGANGHGERFAVEVNESERLRATLRALRQSLGADAICIENVRGFGYRFICRDD